MQNTCRTSGFAPLALRSSYAHKKYDKRCRKCNVTYNIHSADKIWLLHWIQSTWRVRGTESTFKCCQICWQSGARLNAMLRQCCLVSVSFNDRWMVSLFLSRQANDASLHLTLPRYNDTPKFILFIISRRLKCFSKTYPNFAMFYKIWWDFLMYLICW